MTDYRIWCSVWSGVTGTREGWLKSNGDIVTFPTRAAADQRATQLMEQARGPYQTAQFSYTVRECPVKD